MTDTLFPQLKKRLHETYSLDPNDLAHPFLTGIFKKTTGHLKLFPFKIIIPVSIITTFLMYGILGFLIARLVSILQFGF